MMRRVVTRRRHSLRHPHISPIPSNLSISFYSFLFFFFFLNDPAPTDIYTLPLHDALPIYVNPLPPRRARAGRHRRPLRPGRRRARQKDRKSTRLNSSHLGISYAVFCL